MELPGIKEALREPVIVKLSEMTVGQFADTFALLATKEQAKTREDKPYYRVTFKDARRSAVAMIWADHALYSDCDTHWKSGSFYKLRCRYQENSFGSQVDIDKIRSVNETDAQHGFSPDDFYAATRFDRDEMFAELVQIASTQISELPLRQLVVEMLTERAEDIKQHAAAAQNHHAFIGGYLEHTLSVVRTAVFLADKYIAYYTKMQPPLSKSLIVAGAILHDIGKLYELKLKADGWQFTAKGRLVGHILIGRDMMRDKAATIPDLDPNTALHLEHIILAHQNLPEWGSPVSPHSPEALLVHFADDIDAKFHQVAVHYEARWPEGTEFTSRNNVLRRSFFLGLAEPIPESSGIKQCSE